MAIHNIMTTMITIITVTYNNHIKNTNILIMMTIMMIITIMFIDDDDDDDDDDVLLEETFSQFSSMPT